MKRYCVYCGRVAHRCDCARDDSRLQRFLARANRVYSPRWRDTPYKRGVPPQIKRQQRALMRRHYAAWYAELVTAHGERCAHCGVTDEPLAIDHIVPVARGGLSERDNCQLLCAPCNTLKGKLVYDCAVFG